MLWPPPLVANGCPALVSRTRAGMLSTDASVGSVPHPLGKSNDEPPPVDRSTRMSRRQNPYKGRRALVESRNAQPITPSTRVGVGLAKRAACQPNTVPLRGEERIVLALQQKQTCDAMSSQISSQCYTSTANIFVVFRPR